MYNWELKKFIEERNGYLGGDDLLKVISIEENPQLTFIKYSAFENSYYMCARDGESFYFKVMPYEEAKAKNLFKVKK